MTLVEHLLRVDPSRPLLILPTDAPTAAELVLGWADASLTVRSVRGSKARTLESLFDEFSAALQFPYYFGENWPAFSECLADLDWLSAQTGFVVVIYEASQLLQDEQSEELAALVRAIYNAAASFGEPLNDSEWWDRPALPFHVVLADQNRDALGLWQEAGAELVTAEP
ncbi:barstar family protein [Arthrobacter sp. NPDC056727]|uniref:barstar family protein n=1 Tax=Arthrobacter sp. NPDC056727 TaxID=3345927 RepID=UPI0036708582